MSRPEKEDFEPNLKERIRTIVEMNDSLVDFEQGKEHCILPEHYDELTNEIVDTIDDELVKITVKKQVKFKSDLNNFMMSFTYCFVCTILMIWLNSVGMENKYAIWIIGCIMGMVYYVLLGRKSEKK